MASGLRLNSCAGVDDQVCKDLQYLELGEMVCGKVAERGERIVINNLQQHQDPCTEHLRSLGVQVYACHPLLAHGKVIGTLSFGSRKRTQLDPEELGLLQTISNQVAMALDAHA